MTNSIIFNKALNDMWTSACSDSDIIAEQERRLRMIGAQDMLVDTYDAIEMDLYDALCAVDRDPWVEWTAMFKENPDVDRSWTVAWWLLKQPDRAQLLTLLDLYIEGYSDEDGFSIGQMEELDEMDTICEADNSSLIGLEYDDPEGRWLIVGQAHDVVNIRCIDSKCHHNIGFQSCVPIGEAQHYLTHDHTNW